MALWDQIKTMMALGQRMEPELQTRNIPDMDMGSTTLSDMFLRVQGLRTSPWRAASIREAMGTPAIFRAVSLISNTTGSLAMETFRNGAKMPDDQTPSIVKRPDPFRTQRAFYRDCGYHLATRGELWWWIARRDSDGMPLSLIIMPPWEVVVQNEHKDRLRPTIKWLDQEIPRDDVRLITFMPDERSPAGPFQRGVGPLQLCGSAISVAVESTEWAANYYAGGGRPPLIIKSATELGENPDDPDGDSEADLLRAQWMDQDPNTPRVIDPGIEDVLFPPPSDAGAQMLDARNNENGNAARMYGIPGSLLEYQQSGSSLTYQNLEGEFTKFVKVCLAPGYLEPVEQEMSDLLTRSTVARFNVRGFTRADQKTRWETYQIMATVLGPDEASEVAREQEGLAPGDVEFAPIPFSPPAAVPTLLPIPQNRSAEPVRCTGKRMLRGVLRPCNKLLAESAPFVGKCPRCGTEHDIQVRTVAVPLPTPVPTPVIPITRKPESAPAPVVEEPPAPSELAIVTSLLERLPERIAAALPRSEPPIVNVMPAPRGRTILTPERDGANNITRIIRDEEVS